MTKEVVLITGATSGIGRQIALYLAQKGYKVYGTGRSPEVSEEGEVTFLSMDVRDESSIKNAVSFVVEKEGRLDVLINNAGIGMGGSIEETPVSALHNVFATNLYGAVAVIQAVLPIMRRQRKGFIINITSIAGYMGLPFRAGYSASKGALALLAESLRLELKPFGIRVSNIAPGDFATDIASRRYYVPFQEDSPYGEAYQKSLQMMDKHVRQGENPIQMARKIYEVMQQKNPKVHYKQARFLQRISVFLKQILPDRIYERLLMKYYQL